MSKKKISKKQQQASMQSDALEMSGFSEGVFYGGDGMATSYSLGQLDLFQEDDMRDKYPALKQAWEHYQSVLEVCKTKEQEDED